MHHNKLTQNLSPCVGFVSLANEERASGTPIVLLGGVHLKEKDPISVGEQFTNRAEIKGEDGGTVAIHIQEVSGKSWLTVEDKHELFFRSTNLTVLQKEGMTVFRSILFSVSGTLTCQQFGSRRTVKLNVLRACST